MPCKCTVHKRNDVHFRHRSLRGQVNILIDPFHTVGCFLRGSSMPRTPRMMYSIRLAQAGWRPKAQLPWWWLIRCLNGDIESMKEHGVTEGVNKLEYKWPSKVCYVVLSFRSSYFSVAFTVVFLQCELKMRLRFLNNHVRLTRIILEIKKLFILLEVHLNI